jgi:hypothetical protein
MQTHKTPVTHKQKIEKQEYEAKVEKYHGFGDRTVVFENGFEEEEKGHVGSDSASAPVLMA